MKKFYSREIDELGRVQIPQEIKDQLQEEFNLELSNYAIVSLSDHQITLSFEKNHCIFCDTTKELHNIKDKYICGSCITALNNDEIINHYEENNYSEFRAVDEQLRIALPVFLRKKTGLSTNKNVFLYVDNGLIYIKPTFPSCHVCGDESNLMPVGNIAICSDCLSNISNLG